MITSQEIVKELLYIRNLADALLQKLEHDHLCISSEQKATVYNIQCKVANYFNVPMELLLAKTSIIAARKKSVADARAIAIYLCRLKLDNKSISGDELGRMFNRDATTVKYSVKKIKDWIDCDYSGILEAIRLCKD